MTPDELKQALIAKGWTTSKDAIGGPSSCGWYAWLSRQDSKTLHDCVCNDKPPTFLIRPYYFESTDHTHSSVVFEVCGELPSGQWVKFEAYSVKMADALTNIEPAKKVLQAAWDAAWEAAEPTKEITHGQ